MFDTFLGLPVHPLVVHASAVIVPAAALVVALAAVWPRFRVRCGPFPLMLSIAALVLTPASIQSGKALERRVGETALVERHSALAENLLPWVTALVLTAAALLLVGRRERRQPGPRDGAVSRLRADRRPGRVAVSAIAVAVVAMVSAAGAAVQIVRIGHSGSEAAWSKAIERGR